MKKTIEQMRCELISKLKTLEAKEAAQIEAEREKASQLFIKSVQASARTAGVDFCKVDADILKVGLGQLMVFLKAGSLGQCEPVKVDFDLPA